MGSKGQNSTFQNMVILHIKLKGIVNAATWMQQTLLQQGISKPIVYGDSVYKRIVGKSNFSDKFKKIVKRYIRVGYNLDIMRQSACLVLNPITVYSYGSPFNCTTVGQVSHSMTALTLIGVLVSDAYL